MRKVAIIDGATSFIGVALVNELMLYNYEIYAIIRPHSKRINLIKQIDDLRIHIVECELEQSFVLPSLISDSLRDLDGENSVIEYYHIGWSSDFENSRYNRIGQMKNVEYTTNAFRTAGELGCKKFVAIGSQAECGLIDSPICSFTLDNPITAYGEAKCETYRKCCELSKEIGVGFYWPRLLSAYGPYDRSHTLIMSCIDACVNHKHVSFTAAEQIWDYVYVNDVAKALRLITEKGQPLKKYSIASGVGRPLREYIRIIADVYCYSELLTGIGERPYSDNEVMYLVGDVSEIKDDTGMVFDTDFDRLIREMRATKLDFIDNVSINGRI